MQTADKTGKETLTNTDDIAYLLTILQAEDKMVKGKIRPISRQRKCPKCGQPFKHFSKLGYICPECKTTPSRFYIDLHYKGERPLICSDKSGQPLDTYQRALNVLSQINYEIDHHCLDLSKYVRSWQQHFYVSTLIDKFQKEKLGDEQKGEIKPDIAPSYRKDYKLMIKRAKEFFIATDVRDIRKKKQVKDYAEHLSKKYKLGGKTVKNHVDLFHHFLCSCKEEMQVIDTIPPFPEIDYKTYQFKWVNQVDQQDLFQLVPEQDKYMIAGLMLHGYRPSEGRALKCKDVDLNNQSITVSCTFSGTEYREKRKGKKSKLVVIPINPEMVDYITHRVKNNHPEAWLFPNKRGTHYSPNRLRRIWDIVTKGAGIDKKALRLYDATRHSFASQLINSNTSLIKVSRLLGHSSTKTTEKYSHHDIEALRADIQKISLQNREQTVNKRVLPLKKVNKNKYLER